MLRTLLVALAVGMAGSVPASVLAQATGARIVSVRAPAEAREVADALAEELARRLQPEGLVVPRPSPASPDSPAADRLEHAARLYGNLQPAEAAAELDALLADIERLGGGGIDRAGLLHALLLRGMTALALGDAEATSAMLDRALAVNPELAPDPRRYPPTLRSALDARRGELPRRRFELSLSGVPPDAEVTIDAAEAEGSRWSLAPGLHLVRVEAPGYHPWARTVLLDSDAVLALDPRPDPEGLLRAPTLETDPGALEHAARELDAGLLLVDLRSNGQGWQVRVFDRASRRSASSPLDSEGSLPRVAGELARALAAPSSPPALPDEHEGEDEAQEVWPFLVAGGVLAAAVATALLLLLSEGEPNGGSWTRP